MNLNEKQKSAIFDIIFNEYVVEHGLGGMSKSDFNALFLWLVVREVEGLDLFSISNLFKITESRIKSLLETAAVKFDDTDQEQAWFQILTLLEEVEFDIESIEKGQIRFQFKNPMLFRWFQDLVRKSKSTCTYQMAFEILIVNLDTLYFILDNLWERTNIFFSWNEYDISEIHPKIQKTIGNIGKKIRTNELENLRQLKRPKLRKILADASTLISIGQFIIPLVKEIQEGIEKSKP